MATAADSAETWKGPRISFSGLATRLRWPRLSFRRCTVMVPAEGEGWRNQMTFTEWMQCDVLLNYSLMAVVNCPPSPARLSRKSYGDWLQPDPVPE